MKVTDKQIKKIQEWGELPEEQREPKSVVQLALQVGLSRITVTKLLKGGNGIEGGKDYDSDEYLSGRTADADVALLKSVKSGNAQAAKIFYQLMDRLREKSEVRHEFDLDATSFNKIATEVTDRLRENHKQWGGSCPVCGQHQTLRNQSRLDTEPEHTEDREVETVALSIRPD